MTTSIRKSVQKGFSLLEMVIAMALLALISSIALDVMAPWLAFKDKLETESKLEQIKESLEAAYSDRAFRIDSNIENRLELEAGSNIFSSTFRVNPDVGGNDCVTDIGALARWTRTDPEQLKRDGYGNEFCVEVFGGFTEQIDGYTLPYHQIVVYSVGKNGRRDLIPAADPIAGTLTIDLSNGTPDPVDDFDDIVMVFSGFDIQKAKYLESKNRIEKVAGMHETFFIQRFLANPTRDISLNYFCRALDGFVGYDNGLSSEGQLNSVECTPPNVWEDLGVALEGLGFSTQSIEARSAWEEIGIGTRENVVQVSMRQGTQNGMVIKSPDNGDSPPFTVLYRFRLPGLDAGGNPAYFTRLVAGRY